MLGTAVIHWSYQLMFVQSEIRVKSPETCPDVSDVSCTFYGFQDLGIFTRWHPRRRWPNVLFRSDVFSSLRYHIFLLVQGFYASFLNNYSVTRSLSTRLQSSFYYY